MLIRTRPGLRSSIIQHAALFSIQLPLLFGRAMLMTLCECVFVGGVGVGVVVLRGEKGVVSHF